MLQQVSPLQQIHPTQTHHTTHLRSPLSLACRGVYLPVHICLSVSLSVAANATNVPTNQPLTVTPVGRSQPASKQRARQLVRLHTKASN